MSGVSALEAFRRRLVGSLNKIYWSGDDVARIATKLKLLEADDPLPALPVKYHPTALPSETRVATTEEVFTFVISSDAVDRSGDVIAVGGWQTSAYMRNPIVLFAHKSDVLPVGRATAVWREGRRLMASMIFASDQYSQRVKGQVKSGILRATSVGFRPLKFQFADDRTRPLGINFHEQELLEFSLCPIPCNPEALLVASSPAERAVDDRRAAKARRLERDLELIRIRANA